MPLEIGQVYRLPCKSCVERNRPKFYIVALTWPDPLFFLINSEVSPFQAGMRAIAATQIPVLQAEHAFLRHDSWLDCSNTKRDYTAAEIERLVADDPSIARGSLSAEAFAAVRACLATNKLLPRDDRTAMQAAWAP
jgi:hypothetical protein